MKYRTARILVILLYIAAAVSFLARGVFTSGAALTVVTVCMFVCVAAGFALNYSFLRCPKCGRVMKAFMNPDKGCPYCGESLTGPSEDKKEK